MYSALKTITTTPQQEASSYTSDHVKWFAIQFFKASLKA